MKNNNYNNNINIIPVVSYFNADKYKFIVYKENKNKSGIYRWNNLITSKSYIGSSISLGNRFSNYYSLAYLKKKVGKGSSIIYNSLLKHGYSNFSIDILEYCEPSILIKREQYYLDILKPEYNILKTAGSLYGFKQRIDSIERTRRANLGRKHDEATKLKLSANSQAHPITAINNKTGEIKLFTSIRQTAIFIGINHSYLSRCLAKKKFYIGKVYSITKNLCNNNSKFS